MIRAVGINSSPLLNCIYRLFKIDDISDYESKWLAFASETEEQ